jgi:hypothetical protein
MRKIGWFSLAALMVAVSTFAQGQEAFQPVGTMSQVMVSMVYPAANEILLSVARGGPQTDKEWETLGRSAVLLGESGNVLMIRGHALDQGNWMKESRTLVDAGAAASKAIRAKDAAGLTAVSDQINASCVNCHKQYRRNVHPAS